MKMYLIPIGDKVRMYRIRRFGEAFRLAEKAGISPTYLSQIENNRISPGQRTLVKLSNAIGIEVDVLKEGTILMNKK